MTNINYLYHPEDAKPFFSKNYFIDKKLGFQVIEKGMILPHKARVEGLTGTWLGFGGIADSNGKAVVNSFAVGNSKVTVYTPPQESIQYSSETVIYLGTFISAWGHFITDGLRLMWFLKSEDFNQFKNCRLVYIPWNNILLENNPDYVRLLEILGLSLDKLHPITQPTQFERIILPKASFLGNTFVGGFTNEYRETIEILRNFALKNRTPTSSKKLYFYYGKKSQVGEDRLAEYLKSKGYETITHEQRSNFDEELNLLINCESFASPLGSCGLNSVFLRDGTETIFIPRSSIANSVALTAGYQQKIDQMNSLNANYVDSTLSVFNVGHDAFCFIISEQLKRFFGDKWNGYEEGDFKAFLDYLNSYLRRSRAITPEEEKGYGSVFTDFMAQLKRHKDLIASYNMPSDWDAFRSLLTYRPYFYKKGLSPWHKENQVLAPLDQKFELSAIRVHLPVHKLYYSVYFNDKEGWSQEILDPELAGTIEEYKPIYGIRIRLDEGGAKEFDVLYRMHKFDDTWTPWAKNGEALYSHGVKVNAIQIKLELVKPIEDAKKFDYTQTFWLKDDAIYSQGQRQDLIQIKNGSTITN